MKHLALVTGATSGIGKAISTSLAQQEMDLIITGRREDRLQSLKAELESQYGVTVTALSFDISKRSACEAALQTASLKNLTVLVNNAGLARGAEALPEAHLDDWDAMIDTNVKGLLYVTRLALPQLVENGALSHIVNIGSVSGQWVYPGGGVYCATKHAVGALTQGLRMDLIGTGVRVTNISPGMVETEFSNVRFGDSEKADAVYKNMTPLTPADIAGSVLWCLQQPKHVNIQELTIFPTDQAAVGQVHRNG